MKYLASSHESNFQVKRDNRRHGLGPVRIFHGQVMVGQRFTIFFESLNVNGGQKFIRWLRKNQISWCDRASRRHWLVTVQNLYTKTFHTDHNSLLRFRWSPRQKYPKSLNIHFTSTFIFLKFKNLRTPKKKKKNTKTIMVIFSFLKYSDNFIKKYFNCFLYTI